MKQAPLAFALDHARRHDLAGWDALDLSTPPDLSRRFLPEPLVPLFHHPIHRELDEADQLRLNQLTGMVSNELFAYFEESIVVPAVLAVLGQTRDPGLREALERFVADERRHVQAWRAINRWADPARYAACDRAILGPRPPAAPLFEAMARRPHAFPWIFWLMLAQEERSRLMARLMLRDGGVEPRFADAYKLHMEDELRHTALDEVLLDGPGARLGAFDAFLLPRIVRRYFVPPVRAGAAAVRALAAERPLVRPLLPRLLSALPEVARIPSYRRILFSAEATPVALDRLARIPRLAAFAKELECR